MTIAKNKNPNTFDSRSDFGKLSRAVFVLSKIKERFALTCGYASAGGTKIPLTFYFIIAAAEIVVNPLRNFLDSNAEYLAFVGPLIIDYLPFTIYY